MNRSVAGLRAALAVCLVSAVAALAGATTTPPPQPAAAPPAGAGAQFATRCGWFSNPTPANISLHDSEDEWVVGVQGGHQVENDWPWPEFKPRQWVKTNGNYGYGCACLEMRVDDETHEVLEIRSTRAKTLAACRQDRALKRWKGMFR